MTDPRRAETSGQQARSGIKLSPEELIQVSRHAEMMQHQADLATLSNL